MECLHHGKEVSIQSEGEGETEATRCQGNRSATYDPSLVTQIERVKTIRDHYVARQAHEAKVAREKGELRATSSIMRLGIIGKDGSNSDSESSSSSSSSSSAPPKEAEGEPKKGKSEEGSKNEGKSEKASKKDK